MSQKKKDKLDIALTFLLFFCIGICILGMIFLALPNKIIF